MSQRTLTLKYLRTLPVNLRKKAVREARNRNEKIPKKSSRKRKQITATTTDLELQEHRAMLSSTMEELKHILSDCELLSDIPFNCTPTELLGEIAIAEGNATTIQVERIGLSPLTIVLHQRQPTIGNLKHAIVEVSRAHQQRALNKRCRTNANNDDNCGNDDDDNEVIPRTDKPPQVDSMQRSNSELVCSTLLNGHEHRADVSWRFLWRAFTLFNVDTNQPIDDRNGRTPLTTLGINNSSTLKFVHRVKYFGRTRQR